MLRSVSCEVNDTPVKQRLRPCMLNVFLHQIPIEIQKPIRPRVPTCESRIGRSNAKYLTVPFCALTDTTGYTGSARCNSYMQLLSFPCLLVPSNCGGPTPLSGANTHTYCKTVPLSWNPLDTTSQAPQVRCGVVIHVALGPHHLPPVPSLPVFAHIAWYTPHCMFLHDALQFA